MNVDGSNHTRLTTGIGDSNPSISPDSKWVLFTNFAGARPTIWKVSIDGGTPQQITDHAAISGRVSPDGKSIIYTFAESPDPLPHQTGSR